MTNWDDPSKWGHTVDASEIPACQTPVEFEVGKFPSFTNGPSFATQSQVVSANLGMVSQTT